MKKLLAVLSFLLCGILCAQTPENKLNRLLGVELLGQDDAVWSFPACRNRLQRSRIHFQHSPGRHSAVLRGRLILGSPCQELAVITDRRNKTIVMVEIVYANKGDVSKRTKVKIRRANRELKEKLSAAFGNPEKKRVGAGSKRQQNRTYVWTCGSAEIILDTEKDEYCQLIIQPQKKAGAEKKFTIDPEALLKNIRRNDFGDVYIANIPMVDQGQKGYCSVATAARVMLYFGITDVNQHKLADEAGSDSADGTNVLKLKKALRPIRKRYDLKQSGSYKIDMKFIVRHIDNGIPIFWMMHSTKKYNMQRISNTAVRRRAASPEAWKKALRRQKKIKRPTDASHICLIIGYNEKTGEIAVSNSWGTRENAPSWISLDTAEAVNIDSFVFHL